MGIRLSWALLAICVVALLLGGMRGTSVAVERALFLVVYLIYLGLTVAALLSGKRSPGLIAFVVFGWGYLVPVFVAESRRWEAVSPLGLGVVWAVEQLNPKPPLAPNMVYIQESQPDDLGDRLRIQVRTVPNAPSMSSQLATYPQLESYNQTLIRAATVGHLLMTFVLSVGGMFAATLIADRLQVRERRASGVNSDRGREVIPARSASPL